MGLFCLQIMIFNFSNNHEDFAYSLFLKIVCFLGYVEIYISYLVFFFYCIFILKFSHLKSITTLMICVLSFKDLCP